MRERRDADPYRTRAGFERAVLRPDWGRAHPSDPNWADGQYHGMRTAGGRWQASYGRHRTTHSRDLGGWEGPRGRYGRPVGGFDGEGLLGLEGRRAGDRVPREPSRADEAFPDPGDRWQGGGVRGDAGYLRQYNSHSPALGAGQPRRAYGWAEGPASGRPFPDDGAARERG